MRITDEQIRNALHSVPETPEETDLRLYNEFTSGRKPAKKIPLKAAVIAIPAMILLTGAGIYTAHSGGYFKDVKDGFGTVISTQYVNATDDLSVTAMAERDRIFLTVEIPKLELSGMESFPYSEFEEMRVKSCIVECGGKEIRIKDLPYSSMTEKGSEIEITLDEIVNTSDMIIVTITEFEGSKKADQPLSVHGEWKIELQ